VRLRVEGELAVLDYQGNEIDASPADGELRLAASEKVTYVTGLEEVAAR
jgi:hypothetical protein